MSNSTDSLKRKVCVTVFLDELFEEVDDEDRDPNQVSEVTESEVKIAEKTCKTSSKYDLDYHEKINNSPNSDTKENEREPRPRKHRRESKFSRNPCDSFKYVLDKYECGVNNKANFKRTKPVESTFSDSDLDQYLELSKCLPSGSKSSLSEFSELDLKEENFAAVNLSLSSMMVCGEKGRIGLTKILDDNTQSGVISYCSRSTQFDGRKKDVEKADEKFESYPLLTEDRDLVWKNNRKQIQLILAKARGSCKDQEVCDRDHIKHFDLKSILKECEKRGKKKHSIDGFETYADLLSRASMDFKESDIQNISDSHTCTFPRDREESQNRTVEVKRVWSNTEKNVWNNGFESDASDPDCTTYIKRNDSLPLKVDSSLYYALCVKCRENILKQTYEEINANANNEKVVNNFKSTSVRSSLNSRDSKTLKGFGKAKKNSVEVSAAYSHFVQKEVQIDKKETDVEIPPVGNSEIPVSRKNKNYAEGDTVEKSLSKVSELPSLSKKELFVGKKIISDMDETSVEEDKTVFDKTEVALVSKSKTRKEKKTYRRTHKSTEGIAEVFIKTKKIGENTDRNMTDGESEMNFAESEDFCKNEDFLNYKFYFESTSYKIHSELSEKGKDLCVIEIENKLSRSKLGLRRIKTVEILGDESVRDMKNISTEVILICEKVSNNDLCLEASQSSVSTLRSFTEMGQCYLKDSKDSSMYLIEIPLHFIHPQRK